VGHTAGLGVLDWTKNSCPYWDSISGTSDPWPSHHTGSYMNK
jgi:hypothetical protein